MTRMTTNGVKADRRRNQRAKRLQKHRDMLRLPPSERRKGTWA